MSPASTSLDELADGDRIRVSFRPPRKDEGTFIDCAEGAVRVVAGMVFVQDELHRRPWSMPAVLDLRTGDVASIERLETAAQAAARKARAARGEIVIDDKPRNAVELEDGLDFLAEMIARETDRAAVGGRQGQLLLQFNDLADLVDLAQAKRTYLLTRARIGRDFHPWTDGDPEIFRNGTVRPLPCDFELRRADRIDRALRLEQSVRIFGEAERETRLLVSRLRTLGHDVRRPHPNAQEVYVRHRESRKSVDLALKPSPNGFWVARPVPPDNKGKAKLMRKVLKTGALEALSAQIGFLHSD